MQVQLLSAGPTHTKMAWLLWLPALERRVEETRVWSMSHFDNLGLVTEVLGALHQSTPITAVISGKAPGADTLGEKWAHMNNVPVVPFPADWSKHGRAAGPIRNQQMLDDFFVLGSQWRRPFVSVVGTKPTILPSILGRTACTRDQSRVSTATPPLSPRLKNL